MTRERPRSRRQASREAHGCFYPTRSIAGEQTDQNQIHTLWGWVGVTAVVVRVPFPFLGLKVPGLCHVVACQVKGKGLTRKCVYDSR